MRSCVRNARQQVIRVTTDRCERPIDFLTTSLARSKAARTLRQGRILNKGECYFINKKLLDENNASFSRRKLSCFKEIDCLCAAMWSNNPSNLSKFDHSSLGQTLLLNSTFSQSRLALLSVRRIVLRSEQVSRSPEMNQLLSTLEQQRKRNSVALCS